jgi:predicted dehydrogenase
MNVALVGCGRISGKHVAAIEAHPDLKLYAACDTEIERATDTPASLTFGDYESMIDLATQADIVSICTPSDLHAKMAIKAARAKKHVLIEKPIALDSFDARCVIHECKENNVKLCVVVQNRFNPELQAIKSRIDDLGKIFIASAVCRWHRPDEYYRGEWMESQARSGGVTIHQAIHHIDALLWLAGDISWVSATMKKQCHDIDSYDTCIATLGFANGALGTFEATTCAYPRNAESSITLVCEKGTVKVGGVRMDRREYNLNDEVTEWAGDYKPTMYDVYGTKHIAQYAEFVSAIQEDRDPLTSGEAATKALIVAERMLFSHEVNGARVDI